MYIRGEWFGIIDGQIRQFLTELSARHTSVLLFQDDNLSRYQSSVMKLGICIDITDIWFGIANEQISSFFKIICKPHDSSGVFLFHVFIGLGLATDNEK